MKTHIVFLSSLWICIYLLAVGSFAQNEAYTIPVQNNTFFNALTEGTDRSIILAGSIDYGNSNMQGLIGKFSRDGSWQWGHQFHSSNLFVDFLSLIKLPDGDFLTGGNDGNTIILVKFSDKGNIVWQRRLSAPNFNLKMVDFIAQDQQIWIAGIIDENQGILFSIKLDGNPVANRALLFSTYEYTYPKKLRLSGDNLVIVGNVYDSDASILNDGFITLLKTDLTILKSWSLGGAGNQYATSLASDGNDILIGLENQQPLSTGIIKMDANGSLKWSHTLDGLYMRGINVTSNHDILFTGGVGDISKFNSNGTWQGGINFFSSGSIPIRSFDFDSGVNLMSGAPFSQAPPYNIHVFRLDSELGAFCNSWNFTYQVRDLTMPLQNITWTTSKDISILSVGAELMISDVDLEVDVLCQETSAAEGQVLQMFQLQPNPVSGQLTIRMPEEWPASKLSLWTVGGEWVQGISMPPSGFQELDLADLPSGVYFLKCTNQLGTFTQKILKVSAY